MLSGREKEMGENNDAEVEGGDDGRWGRVCVG